MYDSKPAQTSALETLEPRRLLSASIDARGILNIVGTDAADTIRVESSTYRNGKLALKVTLNDQTFVFGRKFVHGVRATGGGGNDTIDLQSDRIVVSHGTRRINDDFTSYTVVDGKVEVRLTGNPNPPSGNIIVRELFPASAPATLLGGAGDDTVLGSGADDWIEGGDGNDSLSGSLGKDRIYGDAGNDTLIGGAHSDTLYGGAGDDDLTGDGPSIVFTRLDTTGGGNILLSGRIRIGDSVAGLTPITGGARYFDYVGRAKDVIYGGEGADTFHKTDGAREIKDMEDEDQHVEPVFQI
jgi:Ca2+-binding RTX toxin-like protein